MEQLLISDLYFLLLFIVGVILILFGIFAYLFGIFINFRKRHEVERQYQEEEVEIKTIVASVKANSPSMLCIGSGVFLIYLGSTTSDNFKAMNIEERNPVEADTPQTKEPVKPVEGVIKSDGSTKEKPEVENEPIPYTGNKACDEIVLIANAVNRDIEEIKAALISSEKGAKTYISKASFSNFPAQITILPNSDIIVNIDIPFERFGELESFNYYNSFLYNCFPAATKRSQHFPDNDRTWYRQELFYLSNGINIILTFKAESPTKSNPSHPLTLKITNSSDSYWPSTLVQ